MTETKTLTNLEIFNLANLLIENFNTNDLSFPVKVNFYLQKNMNKVIEMAREIEENRMEIIKKYGAPSEEDPAQYAIAPEHVAEANQELTDLFGLTQEVVFNMLSLDWFDGIELTSGQVKAISIMITED